MIQVPVHIGDYDNTIDLELVANGQALTSPQTDAITRVVLHMKGTSQAVIDSALMPGTITWSGAGLLKLRLGNAGLEAGGKWRVTAVVYSADHPAGIVWDEVLEIFAVSV